jgi:glycerol-3-phosphate acyltransferase PlsX
MKIGFDGMGGDHGPKETVKGAVDALELIKGDIVIFGDAQKINEVLTKY